MKNTMKKILPVLNFFRNCRFVSLFEAGPPLGYNDWARTEQTDRQEGRFIEEELGGKD